jgi:hypothetical protein
MGDPDRNVVSLPISPEEKLRRITVEAERLFAAIEVMERQVRQAGVGAVDATATAIKGRMTSLRR